jgi:hypothetical protein
MKIGVISDTHRHIENLEKVYKYLKNFEVEKIIHLGDDYSDVDEIGDVNILRVPGVFSDVYQDPAVPNRKIVIFSGWRILLSHTITSHENDLPGDAKPEDLISDNKIDVVLYGHTHIPDIKRENDIIFVNPGHLKDNDKKGYPPTFCYLEADEDRWHVRIYKLSDCSTFKEEKFKRVN